MNLLLEAKSLLSERKNFLSSKVIDFKKNFNRSPKLVVVLVGSDPASVIYTSKKGAEAQAIGLEHETIQFEASTPPEVVREKILELNANPNVDGILIQRPLPTTYDLKEIIYWVDPSKDVDCFHPENVGKLYLGLEGLKPCTPFGVMELLKFYKISLEKKLACVIGRSDIVGKPMSALLLQANATVIQAHSKTKNLNELTKQSDILIVAAGKPGLIDHSYVKPGCIIVDVGIHRNSKNKVVGDVDFDSVQKEVQAITPVPGGVGPMTISVLIENTIKAAITRSTNKF